MPLHRLVLALVLVAGIPPQGARAQSATIPDSAAISAVIDVYLHGLQFNDTLSLQRAFWPAARLLWVRRDGTLGELTQAQWYAGFRGHAGEEEAGTLRMTALAQTRDAASATIVEDYARSRYTDYVSLLRIGGRWWIVNKIYTVESGGRP